MIGIIDGDFFVIRRNNIVVCWFLFPLFSSFIPIIPISSSAHASDAKKGEALAQGLCAACHASDGNSVIPANPILAGQHYTYLKNQLNYFQVKEGEDKAKRENAVMLGIASGLSSDDIDNLAAYYSQQKIKPSYTSNLELVKVGEAVYKAGDNSRGIPSCSSCHGPRGLGIPGQYPRISGQHATYTASTLKSYKNGSRANNKQMMAISSRLTEAQINALAEYLAGLE